MKKISKARLTVLTVGVLNAFILFYKEHGRTPSVRELSKEVGLTSQPTHRHILKLVSLGILIPVKHKEIKYVVNTKLFYPLRRLAFMKQKYEPQRQDSRAEYVLADVEIPLELTYSYARDAYLIKKQKSKRYEPIEYQRIDNPNLTDEDLTERK